MKKKELSYSYRPRVLPTALLLLALLVLTCTICLLSAEKVANLRGDPLRFYISCFLLSLPSGASLFFLIRLIFIIFYKTKKITLSTEEIRLPASPFSRKTLAIPFSQINQVTLHPSGRQIGASLEIDYGFRLKATLPSSMVKNHPLVFEEIFLWLRDHLPAGRVLRQKEYSVF